MDFHAITLGILHVVWTLSLVEYVISIGSVWNIHTPKNFLSIFPNLDQLSQIVATGVLVFHLVNSILVQMMSFLYIKRRQPELHKTLSIMSLATTIATSVLVITFLISSHDPTLELQTFYKIIIGLWLFIQVISSMVYVLAYRYDNGYPLMVNYDYWNSNNQDDMSDNYYYQTEWDQRLRETYRDPHLEQAIMNGSIVTPVVYSCIQSIAFYFDSSNQSYFDASNRINSHNDMMIFAISLIVSTMFPLFYRIIVVNVSQLQPPEKRTVMRWILIVALCISHSGWILQIFKIY